MCIDGSDGWSYNFLYMPNFDAEPSYDCNTRTDGCWRANLLTAHADFVPDGFGSDETVRVDYGFARVGLRIAGSGTAELDAATGGYGLNTATVANSVTKWAFGYPAEGKYKGKDLVYCTGPTIDDPYDAPTWGIALQHDRRLIRWPVDLWHHEPGRIHRRHAAHLRELVRLLGADVHVRPEVQRGDPNGLQFGHQRHGVAWRERGLRRRDPEPNC